MERLPDLPPSSINVGIGVDIVFDDETTYIFQISDFEDSRLSGSLRKLIGSLRTNFEDCILSNLVFSGIPFDTCDFLDTHIVNAKFENCVFDKTHLSSCFVYNSTFVDTEISLTNHTGNTFVHCEFQRCNFHRFVFKNCEFKNCRFIDCLTTNRLFDLSILTDCHFENIDLQLESITTNVGISALQLSSVRFRTARSYHEHEILALEEVSKRLDYRNYEGLERISVVYFFFGVSELFYDCIFDLCRDPSWLRHGVSKTAATRLEHLVRFVLDLNENNKIILLPLLHLQDFLNALAETCQANDDFVVHPVVQTLQGLRLQISRYTASFITNLMEEIPEGASQYTLFCDGEGRTDNNFYMELFDHISKNYVEVIEVRIRNSPVEIVINVSDFATVLSVYAAILATRVRITLEEPPNIAISSDFGESRSHNAVENEDRTKKLKKFDLSFGRFGKTTDEVGVRAVAIFSSGLCQRFELGFSASRALKIHRHILRVTKIISKK
jgi:uncharacterized protein YjbI with pentapeptide repeats